MISKALLLIGSPRCEHSNSLPLGSYLADRLTEKGVQVDKLFISRTLTAENGPQKLLSAVDEADLLILAFPLYVDSLPALTIRAMELIHGYRKAVPKRQKLMAIVNCGFSEPHHNQTAADICRKFAVESGLEWMGSARISSGMAIRGKPLQESGNAFAGLMKGLDNAAVLLAEGKPLPPDIESLIYMSLIPVPIAHALFVPGEHIWNSQASSYARERMYDRPYDR